MRWLARTSEHGDLDAALGLVEVHVDEEVAADRPERVADLGVRGRGLRRPGWFVTLVPGAAGPVEKSGAVWLAEPPR